MSPNLLSLTKIALYADESENLTENVKRKIAVEAALELIRAECLGGIGGQSQLGVKLDHHLRNLSFYADQIQEALASKRYDF
jgi:hypothetical protein